MTTEPQLPAGGATLNDPGLASAAPNPNIITQAALERVKTSLPEDASKDTQEQSDTRLLLMSTFLFLQTLPAIAQMVDGVMKVFDPAVVSAFENMGEP